MVPEEDKKKITEMVPMVCANRDDTPFKCVQNARDCVLIVAKKAEDIFADKGFVHPAVTFLTDDQMFELPLQMESYEEKLVMRSLIIKIADHIGAYSITTRMESWVSSNTDPNKGEAIVIASSWHKGENDDGETMIDRRHIMIDIQRDGDRVRLFRNDSMLDEDVTAEGMFIF